MVMVIPTAPWTPAEDKRRLGRCRFWVPPNDYRVQEANQIEIMK